MISKGFYFSFKIEKNKGDRDFKICAWIIWNLSRGVASFTQIRTRVFEKLVRFFKDFPRTPSSTPFSNSSRTRLCCSLLKTPQMGKINN